MPATDNLADYVSEHTSCSVLRWQEVGQAERGPFPISAISTFGQQSMAMVPEKDRFLELVYAHQGKKDCNPLDGKERRFDEMVNWLGSKGLVLPFVGLGVILDVFELVGPWREQTGGTYDDLVELLQNHGGGLFKARLDH